ncbi:MAG: Cof-type HAD-IIB family hydrolase [Tractidigestivibacter sp.]|jgi:Cof subfamily protein (haloacid dehalogenase superfamily)|uniref:Cof-type HAD-IIB family hydrolase n=1 Tax=Tractidigestivibacter sp. TaxID=2847320 RepID=UPI003D8D5A6F
MVKLVFVDMDDTFLNPQKEITEENAHILDVAYERGVQFVPCTGRNISGLPKQLVEHPCVRYAVCGNGGLIVEADTGKVLRKIPIEKSTLHRLYAQLRDLYVTFDIFSGDKIYSSRKRFEPFYSVDVGDAMRRFIISERTLVDIETDALLDAVGDITKATVFYTTPEDKKKVFSAVATHPDLVCVQSLPVNAEISNVEATKGKGLVWLSNYLGIAIADTIAFGDSSNDLSMIEAAGDGVAMGNATDEVKAVADHMTASCADSGVARYLEPLLEK